MKDRVGKLPIDCSSLTDVRFGIDEIDREIIRLIAERSQYVMRAASFKTSLSAVEAKDRVAQVLKSRRAWAQEVGVSPDMVAAIFESMIKHFIAEESAEWRRGVPAR